MLLLQANALDGVYEVNEFDKDSIIMDAFDFYRELHTLPPYRLIGTAVSNQTLITIIDAEYGIKRLPV